MTTQGLPPDVLASIRIVFFQECEELLADLETGLLALQRGADDPEIVNSVFRAVHSIKGSAGSFDCADLVRFAHIFETTLEKVRSGRRALDPEVLNALLRASDLLADYVWAARDGVTSPGDAGKAAEDVLAPLIDEPAIASEADDDLPGLDFRPLPVTLDLAEEPVERSWTIRFRPHASLYAKAGDPLPILRELGRLGRTQVNVDAADLPTLAALEPEQAYLAWTITLVTTRSEAAIREVFEFVDGDCEVRLSGGEVVAPPVDETAAKGEVGAVAPLTPAAEPASRQSAATHVESLRVDLDRVDRLADLAGEIVITHAMLVQRVAKSGLAAESDVEMALEDLNSLTRELRDSVMAIRAQSVKSVFQRMSRLVRETEGLTGKQVDLTFAGETTEVDRTVIERLTDPLTHMVRNAIDHGLETPERRLAAGKPARGALRISAAHRAGRIVIEVSDDGAGVDRERVRAIAVERGLIAADAQLSDEDADNLIFLPGFSTARVLSDLSGRGVGLDVVKSGVQAMGGRIALTSRPGEGSTFTLSLPLTLAVLDGMVISVRGQCLVAPLGVLLESVQPRRADIHMVGADTAFLTYRGEQVPLLDLGEALQYGPRRTDPANGVALLVEDDTGRRAALLVDQILDQRQVVIKSLEANYRRVEGVAAATILGDGQVALILDVDALIAAHTRPSHAAPRLAATG